MSVLESQDLQVWNNEAFDNGEFENSVAAMNKASEFEESIKENQNPSMEKSNLSVKSPVLIKPLNPKNSIDDAQMKPNMIKSKQGICTTPLDVSESACVEGVFDELKIDSEIQEIEREISRLSVRLESLRVAKLEMNAKKTMERKGRILPAKFMDPKQSSKNLSLLKKIEDNGSSSSQAILKVKRRGVTMGPSEIIAAGSNFRRPSKPETTSVQSNSRKLKKIEEPLSVKSKVQRRGVTMGPSEIFAAGSKFRQPGKEETTSVQSNLSKLKKIEVPSSATMSKVQRRGVTMGPSEIIAARPKPQQMEEKLKPSSLNVKIKRRGVTLGPSEILIAGSKLRQLGKSEITSAKSNSGLLKEKEQPLCSKATSKVQRRGDTMGPSEILAVRSKFRQTGKPEITPDQSIQNRRKSCFWNVSDTDESKVPKERSIKISSLSPKVRKTASKVELPKQAMTSTGSKKVSKKEDDVLSSIQPKKLFNGKKSDLANSSLKTGRVIASRYHSNSNQSNDKDGEKSNGNRVKRKWEIPSELVIYNGGLLSPIHNVIDILPRIRTVRCVDESSRDSGSAKRVSELVGKKTFFGSDEEAEEPSLCQALSFEEEGDEV